MNESSLYITVLFLRQGDFWLAQALEYDLAAQGRSVDEAKRAFEQTFVGQLELDRLMKREPLSRVPKAPPKFWAMFRIIRQRRVALQAEPMDDMPADIPPAYIVKAFPETNQPNW